MAFQATREHPTPEEIHCKCATGCRTADCKCLENGAGCSSTCTCAKCINPLAGIATFFGKEGVRASPCFLTYLKNSLEKSKQSTINFESDVLVDELRCKLLGVPPGRSLTVPPKDDVFNYDMDEDMGNWAKEWKKPDLTREQRGALTKKLFIAGLGVEEYSGMLLFLSWQLAGGSLHHSL